MFELYYFKVNKKQNYLKLKNSENKLSYYLFFNKNQLLCKLTFINFITLELTSLL